MPLNYRYNTLVKGTRGEWVEVNDADGTMLGDEYSGKTMYVISIYLKERWFNSTCSITPLEPQGHRVRSGAVGIDDRVL